jgi:hypothetical protein
VRFRSTVSGGLAQAWPCLGTAIGRLAPASISIRWDRGGAHRAASFAERQVPEVQRPDAPHLGPVEVQIDPRPVKLSPTRMNKDLLATNPFRTAPAAAL